MGTPTLPGDPAHVPGKATPTQSTSGRTIILDGVEFPLADLKQYKRTGLPAVREGVSQGEPSDSLFDHTGSWWRERHDWSHGGGQQLGDFGDPGNTSDTRQFYTSRCVDPWTKLELRLHKAPDLMLNDNTVTVPKVLDVGGWLVFSRGAAGGMKATNANPVVPATTWNTVPTTGYGASTNVLDFATDGQSIYATDGGAAGKTAWKTAIGAGTWTEIGDGTTICTHIWYVAGRVLGANGSSIFEIGAATVTPIYTAGYGGGVNFTWSTVFAVGPKIYVGGYINNRSFLYSLTTLSDGTLSRSDEAADFQAGEVLLGGSSYAGVTVLVSSLGIRLAVSGGGGTLTYGPLITDFGRCTAVSFEGRFAYVTCNNYPAADGSTTYTDIGCVRLDLSEFTDQLLPSYAADVRYPVSSHTGTYIPTGIARFNSQTFIAIPSLGLVGTSPSSNYESSGWLNSGNMYFGTTETKRALSTIVRHAAITGTTAAPNVSVQTTITDQDGATLGDYTNATTGSNGEAIDLNGAAFDHLNVKFTLNSLVAGTAIGNTPQVRVWNTRAFPVPATTEQFVLPLLLTTKAVKGHGQGMVFTQDVEFRRNRIIDLWRAKKVITYREGTSSYRVRIDNYQVDVVNGWRDDAENFEIVLTVSLMTV